MNKSTSERYLGDILSSDGKNDLNVTDRYNKGIGYVNQILGILKEISFGHYYFEQAIQLRNAKLVNGMLCSIEAMYGLTIAQIEKLEKCDRQFFRKIFNAPVSTPTESFYIETNTLPLHFIIIGRRLLYYWTILNKSDNELVKQVFKTQQLSPVKNDWCEAVKLDMKFLDIDIMENDIIGMKKSKFKSLIKRKIREAGAEFLIDLKNSHSKTSNLFIGDEMKMYLTTHHLTTQEKQLLFSLRTRTFKCKANYRNQFNSLQCDFCTHIDDQEHLLKCSIVKELDLPQVNYSDIHGTLDQQIKIAKVMKLISDKRQQLESIPPTVGSQEHLL